MPSKFSRFWRILALVCLSQMLSYRSYANAEKAREYLNQFTLSSHAMIKLLETYNLTMDSNKSADQLPIKTSLSLRAKLRKILNFELISSNISIQPNVIHTEERTQNKILTILVKDQYLGVLRALVSVPKNQKNIRTILALHGHGRAVQGISSEFLPEILSNELINDFIVLAPEQKAMDARELEHIISLNLIGKGSFLLSLRIREVLIWIKVLEKFYSLPISSMGIICHSGGCSSALPLIRMGINIGALVFDYSADFKHKHDQSKLLDCETVPPLAEIADSIFDPNYYENGLSINSQTATLRVSYEGYGNPEIDKKIGTFLKTNIIPKIDNIDRNPKILLKHSTDSTNSDWLQLSEVRIKKLLKNISSQREINTSMVAELSAVDFGMTAFLFEIIARGEDPKITNQMLGIQIHPFLKASLHLGLAEKAADRQFATERQKHLTLALMETKNISEKFIKKFALIRLFHATSKIHRNLVKQILRDLEDPRLTTSLMQTRPGSLAQ